MRYCHFRKLRLIDIDKLKQHDGPFELQEFKFTINNHIQECKKTLMEQYYFTVTDIFLQGSKKNKLPDPSKVRKMRSFYACVATLMTYHLQTLCLKSLYDFTQYITDIKVEI